jgi:hypothetical protein
MLRADVLALYQSLAETWSRLHGPACLGALEMQARAANVLADTRPHEAKESFEAQLPPMIRALGASSLTLETLGHY